jgi:rubrerythrin
LPTLDQEGLIMTEHRMRVIREVRPALQFIAYAEQRATGVMRTLDVYLCGECGTILARHLPPDALRGVAFRCPTCHALNESTAKPEKTWLPLTC